jgi:hypothetical protein
VVVQAQDVAGPGFLGALAIRRHECQGIRDAHVAPDAHVPELHAANVAAGADTEKCDAVAVRRIHVRLDLEHEARQRGLAGLDLPRSWWRAGLAGAPTR